MMEGIDLAVVVVEEGDNCHHSGSVDVCVEVGGKAGMIVELVVELVVD